MLLQVRKLNLGELKQRYIFSGDCERRRLVCNSNAEGISLHRTCPFRPGSVGGPAVEREMLQNQKGERS